MILVLATQGPLQGAIFATPIAAAAWHTKPGWFVIAANDCAIAPEQEKATAKRMGAETLTLDSSHVAMLAKPKEVTDFIAAAAMSGNSAPTVASR
jgi:pimeloyl-ACP methyl ester carboxylesterase